MVFVLDLTGRKLSYGDDELILTKKEFDLLQYLALHKKKVLAG